MPLSHLIANPTPVHSSTEPVVWVIEVLPASGDLDDAAAARLLRRCEARMHLLDLGQAPLHHLLVEVSHARCTNPSAVAILDHARVEAERRHVGIYLVGAGRIMICAALPVRQRLGRWKAFPTLDVARAVLAPPGDAGTERSTLRPIDPDAILLAPPIDERLG